MSKQAYVLSDEAAENGVVQQPMFAGVRSGKAYGEHWSAEDRGVDFYDVKGDVEALLKKTGVNDVRFVASEHSALHPGQSAAIYRGERCIDYMGALHPKFEKTFGLNQRAFVFELQLDAINQRSIPSAQPVSRFPSIRRDLAVVLDERIAAGEVLTTLKNIGVNQLIDLNLFDVYQGDNLPEGKRSLALSVTLQDNEKTLEETEINGIMEKLVSTLQSEFDATLRD